MADNIVGRETTPKYYFVDNGIVNLITLDNDTTLLENLVAIELLRRYGLDNRVCVYKKGIKVDFYMPDESLAIQVSYNPRKSEETWQRESSALIKLNKVFKCNELLIISYEDEEELRVDNDTVIKVIPVWKWLLA